MGTFGCHNCHVNLQELKGKPYEQWPCATCALSKDYTHTFNTGYFDTGKLDELEDEHSLYPDEHEFVIGGSLPLTDIEIHSLESIRTAIEHQMLTLFSGLIVKLLHMAKKNPTMFEVLIKKMQFPYMSYSDIGNTLEPKCTKQNVLYHLKCAVEEIPELGTVIHTDTRYSAGHYALKTIADKKRQEVAEERIQQILYGHKYMLGRFMNIEELNGVLRLPFTMRDEVFTFNAYLNDEEHTDDTAADTDKP